MTTGLGPSFSLDALTSQSGMLLSLLPGSASSGDPGLAGLDDLVQANAQEESLLQADASAQLGTYDPTGTYAPNGAFAASPPDDMSMLDSLMPGFGSPGDATLLADTQLLAQPTIDLFA